MQYIIMFLLVVAASLADVITGLLKARITGGYDSTIMKKGLYSKCLNWTMMAFSIIVDIGLKLLGDNYDCTVYAAFAGALESGLVFGIIMLMESVSVAENFTQANPDSQIAQIIGKRLRKFCPERTDKEDEHDKRD